MKHVLADAEDALLQRTGIVKARMPTVTHLKERGNGYVKGSPLFEKQEQMIANGTLTRTNGTEANGTKKKYMTEAEAIKAEEDGKEVDIKYVEPNSMFVAAWLGLSFVVFWLLWFFLRNK